MKVDVSVLITCFNKEPFLDECINSVLRQTKQPLEIIVVHDCCDSPAHHVKTDSIMFKENVGVAGARDRAFKYSQGKLILFLDGDDVMSPDYIEKMILAMTEEPVADIIYPDLYLWQGEASQLTITPDKLDMEFVQKFERVVIPVTCLMRRETYEALEGFKKMDVLEDLDFFVRAMLFNFKFKKAQTLLWYRRYDGTRNSASIDKRKAVLKEIMKQLNFS